MVAEMICCRKSGATGKDQWNAFKQEFSGEVDRSVKFK
jgi:hypothetical protein